MKLLVIGKAPLLRVNRPAYRHLHRLGWQVCIAVPTSIGPDLFQEETEPGLSFVRVPFLGSTVRKWTFPGIEQEIQRFQPDIVLLDGEPDSHAALQLVQAARKSRFHLTILSCENLYFSLASSLRCGDILRALRDFFLRRLLSKTRHGISHIFVLGQDSREAMRRMGFAHPRTSIIPLGFDEAQFHPDNTRRADWRQRLGLSGVVIAYFGRLIPEKGVHHLITALAKLQHLPFTLLMDEFQPSGPYQSQLRSMISSLGLESRTRYAHVTHDEMPGCLNAVDIVAAPSSSQRYWKEQYGRIAPEAMASGCAVITSTSGTLPELVGNAGLLVKPDDTESLTAALQSLITDLSQRDQLSTLGVQHATSGLSSAIQAAKQHAVFQALLQT